MNARYWSLNLRENYFQYKQRVCVSFEKLDSTDQMSQLTPLMNDFYKNGYSILRAAVSTSVTEEALRDINRDLEVPIVDRDKKVIQLQLEKETSTDSWRSIS